MKSKLVLSVEQMKYLRELGLDTSDATFTWVLYPNSIKGDVIPTLEMWRWEQIKDEQKKVCVPAFTLQDIIELLPRSIQPNPDEGTYYLNLYYYDLSWVVDYLNNEGDGSYVATTSDDSFIEAAYEMLCWCIENGYIKELENK